MGNQKTKKKKTPKVTTHEEIFTKELLRLGEVCHKAIEPILAILDKIDWKRIQKILNEDQRTFIEAGWFLIGELTPAELNNLTKIKRTKGKEAFESEIVSIYEADDWKLLKKSINKVNSNPMLKDLKVVIEDCLWAHKSGKYILSIVTGIVVIESIIALVTESLNMQGNKATKILKQWENKFKNNQPKENSIQFLLKESFDNFLESLFGYAAFDKVPPEFLNRHWVIHRLIKISHKGTKAESLRILLAIVFLNERFFRRF